MDQKSVIVQVVTSSAAASYMSPKLPRIILNQAPTAAQQIAHQLLEHLLSGRVKPGDRLPSERQLAETLKVSRSTIRDAMKSLLMLGIITVRPGGGSFFQDAPSSLLPKTVEWGLLVGERHTKDLVEARAFIEIAVARLAAERRSEATIAKLAKLVEEMKAARKDPKRFVQADLAFHMALADASQNSALRDILSGMRTLLAVWIRRVIEAAGDADYSYRRHRKIFEAVKQADPEAAAKAMEEHMNSAAERLKKTLEQYQIEKAQPSPERLTALDY
jgi:GntR family transcriptional repressor for pyruvate dehydrogenase complex